MFPACFSAVGIHTEHRTTGILSKISALLVYSFIAFHLTLLCAFHTVCIPDWPLLIIAIVMMDQNTQRSRGFGFVTFAVGSGGAEKAIDAQPIDIDGKRVEVKLATPKADQVTAGGGGGAGGRFRPGGALGLRAGAAAAASQSTGEFAGLAAAYGRNGWRGGYGSYAFGKNGWNVQGWEDNSLVLVERSGFSFDLLDKNKSSGGKSRARSMSGGDRGRDSKRSRHQ